MAYSVNVHFQKRVADEEEGVGPSVRDLAEYRKTGYAIQRSNERLAEEAKHPASFINTPKSVSGKMKIGLRLPDIRVGNIRIGRQTLLLVRPDRGHGRRLRRVARNDSQAR